MSAGSYTRPDGFPDYGRLEVAKLRGIEEQLLGVYRCYGYDEVHVPSLEYRDLYRVERIGQELNHQLLMARSSVPADFPADFQTGSLSTAELSLGGDNRLTESIHDLVLRPDLTAPIARMFVEGVLRRGPPAELPYRVAYSGQAYRDLVADGLLLKEHRQTGIECIGPAHNADIEVLLVAVDAVRAVGIERWTMQIGHAGLTKTLLAAVGVGGRKLQTVERLLDRAARIRRMVHVQDDAFFRRYIDKVASVLRRMYGDEAVGFESPIDTDDVDAWRERLPERYEALLARLFEKRLGLNAKQVDWALRIARLDPTPKGFFADLEPLCGCRDSAAAFAELRALTDQLQSLRELRLLLTAASGRGIAYYTGMTFELHSADTGSAYTELGGGGRYDELHRIIHTRARRTAAVRGASLPKADPSLLQGVGMCFGLERLAAAVDAQPAVPVDDVRILVTEQARADEALATADRLRAAGLRVSTHHRFDGPPDTDGSAPSDLTLVFEGLADQRGRVRFHDGSRNETLANDDAVNLLLGEEE